VWAYAPRLRLSNDGAAQWEFSIMTKVKGKPIYQPVLPGLLEAACLCGCGGAPKLGNKWINGHNRRVQDVSEETRRKLSEKSKGRPSVNKGKKTGPRPAWVMKKIHDAQRGQKRGPRPLEERQRISEGLTGRPVSEQTRQKISQSNLGKHKHTPESKEKLRIAHTGKKLSEEHRRAIGIKHRGAQHWNWRGGISNFPYPAEWRFAKRKVHARDGRFCLSDRNHALVKTFYPDIHHIDADKENLNLNNLISLCKKCHTALLGKEAQHAPRLRAILTARYGYVYA
jgi:5-methylcytosine-specific restriction endonuclease McrA